MRDGVLAPWGDLGWSEFSFGGGGIRTFAKVLAAAAGFDPWSECGVIDIGAPNTAGRAGGLYLNDPARAPHLGPPHRGGEWRVKVRLSVGTTQMDVWLGLWSSIATYPDAALANTIHGIGIVARAVGAAVNWFGICRAGTTETTLDLGILADGTWREMGWRRADTGVVFFIGDDDVGVITTNIPAQTQALVRVLGLRTADAALKNIQVDYDHMLVEMRRYDARG
jgi:hypothetical protein